MENAEHRVLTQTEAAYIAGFMDGEGSFFAVREKRKENRNGYGYVFCMTVANTNYRVLEWITEVCSAGKISTRHDGNSNHKVSYKIYFNKTEYLNIIPQIIDFLIIKKRQAELLIEGSTLKSGSNNYGNYKVDRLYEIYKELRELNFRGTTQPYLEFEGIRSHVSKERPPCSYPGCTNMHYGNGLCKMHNRRKNKQKERSVCNDIELVTAFNEHQRKCPICENPIDENSIYGKTFCSRECRAISNNIDRKKRRSESDEFIESYNPEKKCVICEAPIPDSDRSDKIFCSPECRVMSNRIKRKEEVRTKIIDSGIQIGVCQRCGGEIKGKRQSAKFCSEECRSLSRHDDLYKNCLQCGAGFETRQSNKNFCSNKCWAKHRNEMIKREKTQNKLLSSNYVPELFDHLEDSA